MRPLPPVSSEVLNITSHLPASSRKLTARARASNNLRDDISNLRSLRTYHAAFHCRGAAPTVAETTTNSLSLSLRCRRDNTEGKQTTNCLRPSHPVKHGPTRWSWIPFARAPCAPHAKSEWATVFATADRDARTTNRQVLLARTPAERWNGGAESHVKVRKEVDQLFCMERRGGGAAVACGAAWDATAIYLGLLMALARPNRGVGAGPNRGLDRSP